MTTSAVTRAAADSAPSRWGILGLRCTLGRQLVLASMDGTLQVPDTLANVSVFGAPPLVGGGYGRK